MGGLTYFMIASLVLSIALCSGANADGGYQPKKVKILHITDVHGWIFGHPHNETLNTDYGDLYSLIEHMKRNSEEAGEDFLVFDTGDLVDGTGMSSATQIHGQIIFEIASQIQYDSLTVGNHDLGTNATVEYLKKDFVPKWDGMYINENTFYVGNGFNDSLGAFHQYVTSKFGVKMLYLGFIYDFTSNSGNSDVTTVSDSLKDRQFLSVMNNDTYDLIIVNAHIDPQSPPEMKQIHAAIRKYHPNKPIVMLGGHRHVNYFEKYDSNSFVLESGCYFQEVGLIEFEINEKGDMDALNTYWIPTSFDNFLGMAHVTADAFPTPTGLDIKKQIKNYWNYYHLGNVYACLPSSYYVVLPFGDKANIYHFYINEVIPGIVYPNIPSKFGKDIPMMISNTASLRYPLFKGEVNYNDILTTCPFNDTIKFIPGMKGDLLLELIDYLNYRSKEDYTARAPSEGSDKIHFIWSDMWIDKSKSYLVTGFGYDMEYFTRILKEQFQFNANLNNFKEPFTDSLALSMYLSKKYPC